MKKEHLEIKALMALDPLHEAELITGNDYKKDESTMWLGFGIQIKKSDKLESVLRSIGDTTLSNKLDNYIQIITEFGFKQIYEAPFVCDGRSEKHFIFWHIDLSILLNFDTFTWDGQPHSVNAGDIYYNWSPNCMGWNSGVTSSGGFISEKNAPHLTMWEKDFRRPYYIPDYPELPKWEGGKGYDNFKAECAPIEALRKQLWDNAETEGKRVIWNGRHDCREALITNIKALFENGVFLNEWKECAFPWLTNYSDHKTTSPHDFTCHYSKTKSIINTFPDEVKKAIGEYKK